jgi:hypothetical protein
MPRVDGDVRRVRQRDALVAAKRRFGCVANLSSLRSTTPGARSRFVLK